jgi:hypothetical protein
MQQKLSRPPAAGGYSVVELIIAVGMAIIVGLGIYAVFNSASRSSQSQKLYNDVQTSCTFAIDQMKTELTLAGYRATDPLRPINPASGTEVTFVYRDDHARNEGPFAAGVDENTKIRYYVASADEPAYGIKTKDLVREYRRATTGTSNYDTFTKQVLAKNIQDLSFAYFKDDNSPWALGGDTKEIRMVRVSLKCEAGRKDPISGNAPQVTVTTEVRARNVGIASVPKDTSPPDTPADGATDATRLLVADPGVCGRLDLRWPANQDADLEGYIIFYGLAPGSYTNRISLSRPPQAAGAFETYSLTGLASTKYADIHPAPGTPVKYYIALAAIDKSGNVSPELSIEASGNPSPDTRTISTFANNDTTINPDVPPAPTVQAIAETPADNVLKLNWSPSTTVVGLTGYRVYRGTTATFVPDGTELTGNKIAELGPGDVTYTDDGHDLPAGKLTGCTPYYYKIAAIACDTTLPVSLMNFATITGTATDATPPSSPILVARPGFKRIILSLNNPVRTGPGAEPDFAYSKIWFNKNTAVPANPIYYPKIDALGAITDGTIVPDSFPYNPATPGTFTKDGTMVVNFNDENDGNPGNTVPNLHYGDAEHPMTYYFLSVAYDQCGNRSLVTSNAVSQGTECFDCLPGDNAPYLDCSEAPPAPANVQASGCFGNLTVSWNAMPEDYRDFAGFHLFRCEGATCATGGIELTGGDPLWFTTFTDTSSGATPILPGVQYSYRVEAADCYYERRGTASDAEKALNNPFDNVSSTTINNVSIGQIDRDTTLPWLVTGYLRASTTDRPFTTVGGTDLTRIPPTFLHNAVTVWLKNSANTTLTLRQLAASWENPLAYLQKVGVGDGNQTPMEIAWQDTAPTLTQGSTGSSVNLSTTSPVTALDDKIPFVTVFKTANGQVNSTVDMRQETLRYTLYFRNDSTNTEGCGVTGYLTVPLGPYLYGVTQDQPSAGTNAWPVPGEQGGNSMNVVTVPGGTKVNVFANVKDTTGVGISAMKVFYYVDTSKGLFTPPPLAAAADYPNALSPWTEIHMLKIAGETWGLRAGFTDRRIPVNDNANVWYFVVAEDAAGNFDREPEVGGGAFQYFQQSGNFCSSIPSPPAITGTSNEGAQSVTLSWTVPSFNATPALSAYTDPAGYHVWRSVDGGSFGATPYADIPSTALNPTTITWTDPETLTGIATSAYSYYVTSYDQCLPPKESVPSNVYTDSVEYPCSSVPQAPALTGSTPGDSSVELVWQVPDQNTSSSSYGDPGGFTIWRNVNDAGWGSAPYASIASTAVWPASITWVDPDTGIDSNTLKNNMYAYKVQAYDNCPSTGTPPGPRVSADSNVYTESQTANACSTVPGAPTGVTVTGADGTGVSLSWTKPPVNVNGTPYGDPGGYYVYRCEVPAAATGCTPAEPPIGTTTVTTYKDIVANAGAVRYGYTVKAYDACTAPGPNVGDFSSPVVYETYTDPCMTTPATPTLLEVTAQSGTGVTLGWTAPTANTDGTALTDLAGYNVYRCQGLGCVPAPPKINVMTVTGTSYTDPVTDAGAKAYYYSVAAVDQCTPTALESARFSPPVPETFADPCSPSPTTPSWTSAPTLAVLVQASDGTALACNGVDSNKARLSWPSATATVGTDIQYEVYRCDSGKSNTACVLSADNQSSNPSFFTTAGAISSRTTKVTTLPAGTLTYTDIPGKAMKVSTSGAATVITYLVRAVNKSCSTQTPQPFYNSIIVAPCP